MEDMIGPAYNFSTVNNLNKIPLYTADKNNNNPKCYSQNREMEALSLSSNIIWLSKEDKVLHWTNTEQLRCKADVFS